MKCPKCQHENPLEARFCMMCTHSLSTSSTVPSKTLSFDEKIDKIQRYLPKGLMEKVLSQRGKIEGERKQVTVMFCDMEGFTPMVEKLGSEQAYSIMDEVYEILIHKVHDYEGTVNEMTGDGIMALFGAPIALEDAPQRALRSALAIHGEMQKFNEQNKGIGPIKMRIGVNTGPVVVGTLGNDLRVEFKAVGDTVNLASRMEGLAEPGTTYVTEDTYKSTEQLFLFELVGEKDIKGKERAISVYKLLSPKEHVFRPRPGLERSIYSEMVGRDKELDKLELQILKAINGEGSVVNVIGEAGIGKSRLVAELKNREVMKRVSLFEGRAISTGRNLSFHPIIDLLKPWARIGEDDSVVSALSKLETAIRRVAPEDIDEILPFVATLMGIKLPGRYANRIEGIEGQALEKLIFKNMRDLIIKATELKPHVIIMEDLHWSDTSSIELMLPLFRLVETQRIVFINVFRPGHKETGDRIVETIKESYPVYYVEINLQPLNDTMSEALIDNMLKIRGLKHAVIDQIVGRADGNPFFIEEVVRSLIDHGAVIVRDGDFEVTAKIDSMVIPHTINDVLMARIDHLEEKTRDLVKIASVIGRSFFYRILKEMVKTIEDIDKRLSYLKEIQLFRERKRMDELEYLFKHALAQEAAYESILSKMRKELHLKVADVIENVFKERLPEFYGMLAYHYSKGEHLEKAEEFMIKSGEEALNSSASSEAIHYYQDALDIYLKKYGDTADSEKIAMLEKNIAVAFFNKGELEDALLYLDSVLIRWGIKQTQNKVLIVVKLLFDLLIVILNLHFKYKKSKKYPANKDIEILSLIGIRAMVIAVLNPTKGFPVIFGGIKRVLKFDYKKIRDWYYIFLLGSVGCSYAGLFWLGNKLLRFVENDIDKNDPRAAIIFNCYKQAYSFYSGEWEYILVTDETSLSETLKTGRFLEISYTIFLFGFSQTYQGKFNSAYTLSKMLSKIASDYEYKLAGQYQLNLELLFLILSRKVNEVQKALEARQSSLFKMRSDIFSVLVLGIEAQLQILLKDYNEAEATLSQAKEILGKQTLVASIYGVSYYLPRFSLDIRLLEESIFANNKSAISKYSKQASKNSKKLLHNSKKCAAFSPGTLRLVGRYYWLIGKNNRAVNWWKKAIEKGKKLDARPDVARTYMEIGKRFLEDKSKYKELNGITAKEYLEKARVMFQEMDLQWDLDELDKITMTS